MSTQSTQGAENGARVGRVPRQDARGRRQALGGSLAPFRRVRTEGDWEGWTAFFLEGVATIAEAAVQEARELFALVARDRARVLAAGKASVVAARLFEELPRHPVVTITGVVKLLRTTKPTAAKAIATLEEVGILSEATGRKRDRTFSYTSYLDLLRVGTELE